MGVGKLGNERFPPPPILIGERHTGLRGEKAKKGLSGVNRSSFMIQDLLYLLLWELSRPSAGGSGLLYDTATAGLSDSRSNNQGKKIPSKQLR